VVSVGDGAGRLRIFNLAVEPAVEGAGG